MNSPLFGGEFIVVKAKTRKMQLIIPIFVKEGVRRTDIVVGTVPGGSGADLAAGFVDYAAVAERRDAGFNDFENIYTETRPLEIEQRNGEIIIYACADAAQFLALGLGLAPSSVAQPQDSGGGGRREGAHSIGFGCGRVAHVGNGIVKSPLS